MDMDELNWRAGSVRQIDGCTDTGSGAVDARVFAICVYTSLQSGDKRTQGHKYVSLICINIR